MVERRSNTPLLGANHGGTFWIWTERGLLQDLEYTCLLTEVRVVDVRRILFDPWYRQKEQRKGLLIRLARVDQTKPGTSHRRF